MAKGKNAVTMTELRANPSRVVRRAAGSKQPIFVTERGQTRAVLLGADAFEKREMLLAILEGERDTAAGRTHSFEEVFAEANKVLKHRPDRG